MELLEYHGPWIMIYFYCIHEVVSGYCNLGTISSPNCKTMAGNEASEDLKSLKGNEDLE